MRLYQEWIIAKAQETAAIKRRREVEDKLVKELGFNEASEGTENYNDDHYQVKVVGRIDRKVDADKLQEIAAEHGLSDHLASLFRWKPEINMNIWKATAKEITGPLSEAITAKAGRPSFTITAIGKE